MMLHCALVFIVQIFLHFQASFHFNSDSILPPTRLLRQESWVIPYLPFGVSYLPSGVHIVQNTALKMVDGQQ